MAIVLTKKQYVRRDFANGCAKDLVSTAITKKIRYALGTSTDKCPNVKYLNSVPIKLLPQVLSFVQSLPPEEPGYKQRSLLQDFGMQTILSPELLLKNIFEVMRNCVVPVLFAPDDDHAKSTKRKRGEMEVFYYIHNICKISS